MYSEFSPNITADILSDAHAVPPPLPADPGAESANLISELEAGWQIYGDTFDISLSGLHCVVVSHPQDIRHIMTGSNFREKGPLYEGVRQVIGDGVLTSGGQKWKDHHRLIVPAFHHQQVTGMVNTIAEVGSNYVEDLKARTSEDLVVDVQEEMTKLTLDTLTAVLFGKHASTVQELTYEDLKTTFSLAGKVGEDMGGETKDRFMEVRDRLQTLAQELVYSAREQEPDNTLLSVLAHAKSEDTGQYLEDQAIRDELLTLMFAGHETTALTLTWLFELTKNKPDVLERMQQEVQEVLQGEKPNIATLPKLTYTRQVIDEVLRLRPPVPIVSRSVKESDTIGGITLKPNDLVLPFIWGAHRHKNFWDQPDQFSPERFSSENSANRDKWAYLPFAAGARICVGKSLALTELSVHTSLLLQNVRLEVISEDTPAKVSMTLRPNDPVKARVASRRANNR